MVLRSIDELSYMGKTSAFRVEIKRFRDCLYDLGKFSISHKIT